MEGNTTILCDVSKGTKRPIVPDSWQRRVFQTVHNLSHPGTRATRQLMSKKIVSRGMFKKINQWTKNCTTCQKSKVIKLTKAPLYEFDQAKGRFSHMHIDIVGPLPPSEGFTHLLTMTDRFT